MRRPRTVFGPRIGQHWRRVMATKFVTSADGTRIAYETMGQGAPLVFVWGALGVRSSPFAKGMREELAKDFTVFDYDRRGRGESGDTKPYAVAREVEDLRAVCEAAGGRPYVAATSSGAALALEAAASGVPMKMLAAHEPPYMVGSPKDAPDPDYEQKMNALIARGKRDERSEEHTSELQSRGHLVCRLLLEKKKDHACICPVA